MLDYLIVGAGLFGSVFAHEMSKNGRSVMLLDRREHIGGNVFNDEIENIQVHKHGPHLFHTNSKAIWDYVNRLTPFNNYQHRVKATYGDKVYSLPFNLMTYYQMWGVTTPAAAEAHLESQKVKIEQPANLEEWALSQVGPDIYHTLIYGYTKKQWGRDPKLLPASIIKRLPLRLTFDDNYFNDRYQGVPEKGYTHLIENLIDGLNIRLGASLKDIKRWRGFANKLVYTGRIDEFFGYIRGDLEYRTLRFEDKIVEGDFQGCGQMNYTDEKVPYTRIVEHKHFTNTKSDKSVITYEYPDMYDRDKTPYYPINDKTNNLVYEEYRKDMDQVENVIVGGRLGRYQYYDMDQVIASALVAVKKELG